MTKVIPCLLNSPMTIIVLCETGTIGLRGEFKEGTVSDCSQRQNFKDIYDCRLKPHSFKDEYISQVFCEATM